MFDAIAVGLLVGAASLFLILRSFSGKGSAPVADHSCGCGTAHGCHPSTKKPAHS